MKKKLNIVPVILVASMMASIAGGFLSVTAEVTFPLVDRAKLSVDFLGVGNYPATEAQNENVTAEDIGKIAWVGVAVEDSYKLTENFTQYGLYNMDIAFDYDTRYLEPCAEDNGEAVTGNETLWLETLADQNLYENVDSLHEVFWNLEGYEFIAAASTMQAPVYDGSDREQDGVDAINMKMMFISIRSKDTAGMNYRFKDSAASDTNTKKYLIRVPFKIKAIPDDITNDNSLLLSLSPQTFVLGSGAQGDDPYAAWANEDKTDNPAINLKNYFEWNGNISLFTPPENDSELENIRVFPVLPASPTPDPDATAPPESTATPRPTEYTLYRNPELTPNDETTSDNEGFDANVSEYYVAVDEDVGEITLRFSPDIGTDNATVTFTNDETTKTINLTSDTVNDCINTDPIGPILQVNPDTVDTDNGYINTITIVVGENTYILHVRRYRKPEIVLNYGNSPYGLIMRMEEQTLEDGTVIWDDDYKEEAMNAFDKSNILEKHFVDGYIPTKGNADIIYTSIAWQSYNSIRSEDTEHIDQYVNYDLDPYALFAYRGTQVKDPGITVYDKFGKIVSPNDTNANLTITRVFKVKQLISNGALPTYAKNAPSGGLTVYDTAIGTEYDVVDNVRQIDAPLVDGYDDIYQLDAKKIRSDVYELKYEVSYKDGSEDVELDKTRKAIILGKLGDLYIGGTDGVSAEDASNFSKNVNSIQNGQSLVAYRCADFIRGSSVGISAEDSQHLSKNVSTTQNLDRNLQYYSDIFEVK